MNTRIPPREAGFPVASERCIRRLRHAGDSSFVLLAAGGGEGVAAEVANWTAGTVLGNYSEPTNWDLGLVPINSVSETYILEVPANAKISYDLAGVGRVDALRLGSAATFTLEGTREFAVQGSRCSMGSSPPVGRARFSGRMPRRPRWAAGPGFPRRTAAGFRWMRRPSRCRRIGGRTRS
ncbi:MAG: hypothetical protein H7A46_08650 [Verrucomicrobiales bacterium]|nr:hypothetical protein [Verrucomicrobiales bacterium]